MENTDRSTMKLSIIIPAYNERESIPELYQAIIHVMQEIDSEFEVIFIDDGSVDGSFDIIKSLNQNDPCVKGLRLRRNFGKSASLNKGFRLATGDLLITMDADLQDDPREIPNFISKLNEGFDLVSGWKKLRKDPLLRKNLPSKVFNWIVCLGSGLKLHDFNCGFKAYRRNAIDKMTLYGEMHRFIPALLYAKGYKVTEIPVQHHARRYGKSKFGISRFAHGLFDFITVMFLTKYLKKPMHLFGTMGSMVSLLGFLICLYLTVLWFSGEVIGHRPLLSLGVLLIIVGMQMITTGFVAEMMNYNNRNRDQEDIVEECLGFEKGSS